MGIADGGSQRPDSSRVTVRSAEHHDPAVGSGPQMAVAPHGSPAADSRADFDPAHPGEMIPFAVPDIGEEEIAAVTESLRSGWVTSGPRMAAFEEEFATRVGGGVEAVATNSATAGLHLALEAYGIGRGDEVLVPTWTFTATAEVVRYLGATPVLVDVDPDTLNISLEAVRDSITPRTRAVLPVHMAGLSADMPGLAEIAAQHDLRIIEDAAHALPTRQGGRLVGSTHWSHAAVFSFYATKTMTTGEGGMVTTTDAAIAERMRVMRLHGIDRDVFHRYQSDRPSWAYDVVAPGFKYNMPDTAAALGRVQLRRIDEMHLRRRAIAERFVAAFADLPLELPVAAREPDIHAWHLFIAKVGREAPLDRQAFVAEMSRRRINCSVHFIPLHEHTYWRESLGVRREMFPGADSVAHRAVSLPLFSRMTDDQVDRVIAAVREILAP